MLYRKVYAAFWDGDLAQGIRGNSDAIAVAFYLLTCPGTNQIGCYRLSVATLCDALGMPSERALEALRELSERGFAYLDEHYRMAFVTEFARHEYGEPLNLSDNRVKALEKALPDLLAVGHKSFVWKHFWERYGGPWEAILGDCCPAPSEGLREGSGRAPGGVPDSGTGSGTGREKKDPTGPVAGATRPAFEERRQVSKRARGGRVRHAVVVKIEGGRQVIHSVCGFKPKAGKWLDDGDYEAEPDCRACLDALSLESTEPGSKPLEAKPHPQQERLQVLADFHTENGAKPPAWGVLGLWLKQLGAVETVLAFLEAMSLRGKLGNVGYCGSVIEDWSPRGNGQRFRPAFNGKPPDVGPIPELDIPSRLRNLAAALPDGLPELVKWQQLIRGLEGDAEKVDRKLGAMEPELLAMAEAALDDEGRASIDATLAGAVANLSRRLPESEVESQRHQLRQRIARQALGLPELSIFSPEAS